MTRPICSIFLATSLDGFIARPNGGIDWLDAVNRADEDYGYADFASTVDAVVLGRKTYDVVVSIGWSYPGKRVLVLTRRPFTPRPNEEAIAGTPADVLTRLAGCKRVYVDGGETIRQFLAADLVDELTISVVPIVLGDGIPLFTRGGPELALSLVSSRAFGTGLVQMRYERVRAQPARLNTNG